LLVELLELLESCLRDESLTLQATTAMGAGGQAGIRSHPSSHLLE